MSYYRGFAPPKEIIDKLQQKSKRARSYNNDSTEIELRMRLDTQMTRLMKSLKKFV